MMLLLRFDRRDLGVDTECSGTGSMQVPRFDGGRSGIFAFPLSGERAEQRRVGPDASGAQSSLRASRALAFGIAVLRRTLPVSRFAKQGPGNPQPVRLADLLVLVLVVVQALGGLGAALWRSARRPQRGVDRTDSTGSVMG
jgi:hypothetical protein